MIVREFKNEVNPQWDCVELECEVSHVKIVRNIHSINKDIEYEINDGFHSEVISEGVYEIIKGLLK